MSPCFLRPFLALILVSAMAGCPAGSGGPPAPEPPPGSATANLENTLWRLTSLGESPVRAEPNLREARFVLTSENHSVRGDTGCNNRLTGTYTLAGNGLHFGPLAATRKACPEPQAKVEKDFLAALAGTASWQITGETLVLMDAQGRRLARFESLYLR